MEKSGLFFPCMIAVYKYVYIYWLVQGLWGIEWNEFGDFMVKLFPIHHWELVIVNIRIGQIHAQMWVMV